MRSVAWQPHKRLYSELSSFHRNSFHSRRNCAMIQVSRDVTCWQGCVLDIRRATTHNDVWSVSVWPGGGAYVTASHSHPRMFLQLRNCWPLHTSKITILRLTIYGVSGNLSTILQYPTFGCNKNSFFCRWWTDHWWFDLEYIQALGMRFGLYVLSIATTTTRFLGSPSWLQSWRKVFPMQCTFLGNVRGFTIDWTFVI